MVKTGFTLAELVAAEWTRRQKKKKASHHCYASQYNSSVDRRTHFSRSESSSNERRTHRKKKKKKKSHGLKRKSRNPSPSSASSSLSVPRDPRNPLHAAYSLPLSQRYMKGRQRSLDEFSFKRRNLHCARKMRCDLIKECYTQCDSPPPNSLKHSERWNHDIFENRSESPVRERTKGAMWDTRQGAWRSRAGGVYLPPSPVSPNEENGGGKPRERPARYKHRNNINHTARYFTAGRRSRSPLFVPRERGSPVYE